MRETEGMVKIIADTDASELLDILGAYASDLIAEGILALSMEATAFEIINTPCPSYTGELISEAAEGITGKPIHLSRR